MVSHTIAITAAQNVYAGGTAQFAVAAAEGNVPYYQWQYVNNGVTNLLQDGAGITGSQSNTLTIANVSSAATGITNA